MIIIIIWYYNYIVNLHKAKCYYHISVHIFLVCDSQSLPYPVARCLL